MRMRPVLYGFFVLAFLFGGVYSAKATGVWQVSGKVNADGSQVVVTGTDSYEIKGWTTLRDVIEAYQLDEKQVYADFNLSEDISPDTPLKDLAAETDEQLTPATIREYVDKNKQ